MSIHFKQRGAGRMTGWTTKTTDVIEITKRGPKWTLEIRDPDTSGVLHTSSAAKQYLCCREACRYFGEGAFRDPTQ